jgi:hypothetical protein
MFSVERFVTAEEIDHGCFALATSQAPEIIRDARLWPLLKCRDEGLLCAMSVSPRSSRHSCETGDKLRLFNPKDCFVSIAVTATD